MGGAKKAETNGGSLKEKKRLRQTAKKAIKSATNEFDALVSPVTDTPTIGVIAPTSDGVADNPGLFLADLVERPDSAAMELQQLVAQTHKKKHRAKVPRAKRVSKDVVDVLLTEVEDGADADVEEDAVAGEQLLNAVKRLPAATADVKRSIPSRNAQEGRPESEFHIGEATEEISMDDLLAPLLAAPRFGDVRKQLEGLSKQDPLPEPVFDVQKGKDDRQVQYEHTSKDALKWFPQIRRMRQADAVVLGDEDNQDKQGKDTTAILAGNFVPTADFERELEEATQAAGANEDGSKGATQLPANARLRSEKERRQSARLKFLMLREQKVSKRLKKIKSKTYHRIKRKGEAREKEALLERLERENPELAKAVKEDFEKKHAQMRLLRQRSSRKKWAATMQRFAKGDKDAQREISKQAQAAHDEEQALRRAIRGKDPDQSEDSEAVDLSGTDSEEEETAPGSRSNVKKTLGKAKKLTVGEIKDLERSAEELPTTGLLGMSFMRKAMEQKREAAKHKAQHVLKELEGLEDELDQDMTKDGDATEGGKDGKMELPPSQADCVSAGRKVFSEEELLAAKEDVQRMLDKEDEGLECSVSGPLTVRGVTDALLPTSSVVQTATPSIVQHNGKLIRDDGSARKAATTSKSVVRNPWLEEANGQTYPVEVAAAAASDAGPREQKTEPVEGDADAVAKMTTPAATKQSKKRGKKTSSEKSKRRRERPVQRELGNELLSALNADSEVAREQRALVRTAFVEGTQAVDFQQEQEELARQKKQERDEGRQELAGWGHWIGEGVKPRRPVCAVAVEAAQTKSRVHIYEGDNAEPSKYFVDRVPFPYKNFEQYNQELRMPAGREWNTMPMHLTKIQPKVIIKRGAIVPPLQYVKHLPPEEKASAIQAWANVRPLKRLKARF